MLLILAHLRAKMWASAISAVLVTLVSDCYAGLKPTSMPVRIVPITNSGKTAGQPLHDAFLTVDVDVGTPGTRKGHLSQLQKSKKVWW